MIEAARHCGCNCDDMEGAALECIDRFEKIHELFGDGQAPPQ